jgi:hypothetical protein
MTIGVCWPKVEIELADLEVDALQKPPAGSGYASGARTSRSTAERFSGARCGRGD